MKKKLYQFLEWFSKAKTWKKIVMSLSCVVVFCTVYALILPAITKSTNVFCGKEEHTHSESCYKDITMLNCSIEESEEHTHSDECYFTTTVLTCDKEEHTHVISCYCNPEADKETKEVWEKTFEKVKLTGVWADDVVEIAKTQVGYKESTDNFVLDEDGKTELGYTRYGDWCGKPYEEWSSAFAAFCYSYADVDYAYMPYSDNIENWIKNLDKNYKDTTYEPQVGDVVFLDFDEDQEADHVAIITEVDEKENKITTIQGDYENEVKIVEYQLNQEEAKTIIGYGVLVENPDLAQSTVKEQSTTTVVKKAKSSGISTLATGTQYSSDLHDFLTGVTIKDSSGETINDGDIIYLGMNYRITLSFAESNVVNNEKQFQYNSNGYLTYTFTAEELSKLNLVEVSNKDIVLGNGAVVGHYWLTTNGELTVKFDNVDNTGNPISQNFIDAYPNVIFNLEFDASVSASNAGQNYEFPFPTEFTIGGPVEAGGALTAVKKAGTYSINDRSFAFTLTVNCTEGVVSNIRITDIPSAGLGTNHYDPNYASIDESSIKYTDLNKQELTAQPTSLTKGEGFIMTYNVKISDELFNSFTSSKGEFADSDILLRIYVKNIANVTYNNGTPNDITVESVAETNTQVREMQKTYSVEKLNISDGTSSQEVNVLHWVITIGDNGAWYTNAVFRDQIGEALDYVGDTVWVEVNNQGSRTATHSYYYDQSIVLTKDYYHHLNIDADGKGFTINLPANASSYKVHYYTTYQENITTDGAYRNVATIKEGTTVDMRVENNPTVGLGVPKIKKTVSGSDGDYIYFNITIDVPASMYGKPVGFGDYMKPSNDPNHWVPPMTSIEDLHVYVQKDSDPEPVEYQKWVSGMALSQTYHLDMDKSSAGQYTRWFIRFEAKSDGGYNYVSWKINEHSVITITYKVPKTAPLQDGQTIADILNQGYYLNNIASFSYKEGANAVTKTSTANWYERPNTVKKGEQSPTGEIDYSVDFTNKTTTKHTSSDSNPSVVLPSRFTDAYLYDDYDDSLALSGDYITALVYSRSVTFSEGAVIQKFYCPVESLTINGSSFKAMWRDFIISSDSGSTINLEDYMNTYHDQYSIRFFYEMVPSTTSTENVFAKQFINKASFGYKDQNGNSIDFEPVTCSIDYSITTLEKTHSTIKNGNEVDYKITVNEGKFDLSTGDTIRITDVMSSNLSIYYDSIHIKLTGSTGLNTDMTYNEMLELVSDWGLTQAQKDETWNNLQTAINTLTEVTYDENTKTLVITAPDNMQVDITYTVRITETGKGITVNNTASINAKVSYVDRDEATFNVNNTSGEASASNAYLTVLKQDSESYAPLNNVAFALYGPQNSDKQNKDDNPYNVSNTITSNGQTLYYYKTYTTESNENTALNGTFRLTDELLAEGGYYALVEAKAPDGYELLSNPVTFAWKSTTIEGIVVKGNRDLLTIQNNPIYYELPETGGMGTTIIYAVGGVLMVTALILLVAKKRTNSKEEE